MLYFTHLFFQPKFLRQVSLSSLYKWETWRIKRLSSFAKVIQLVSGGDRQRNPDILALVFSDKETGKVGQHKGKPFKIRCTWTITYSVQFSHSVVSKSLRPHDYSMPGFPVQHQFPEPTQTHVHHVGDAIQPSHPLLSPSPPTFSISQHQGLFQLSRLLASGAKVLELQLQHQSFQWTLRTDLL